MSAVSSFAFTISLAAVINGLGIVRLMTTFAEYLRNREQVEVRPYWAYGLLLIFQFLMHVLLWWAMFGTREAGGFNFFGYLYLLLGPISLYLATSLLLPAVDGDEKTVDLREQYFKLSRAHFTVVALLWLWAIFLWPVLVGVFAPAAPMFAVVFLLALGLRFSQSEKVHAVLVPAYCVTIFTFIILYQLELGGAGKAIVEKAAG